MEKNRENAIEFLTGEETATVSFTQTKYINRIKKLAKDFPEDIKLKENKDGSICADIPLKWVRISRPRTLTDAEREWLATELKERRRNGTGNQRV